jgi:hypothetical protein
LYAIEKNNKIIMAYFVNYVKHAAWIHLAGGAGTASGKEKTRRRVASSGKNKS